MRTSMTYANMRDYDDDDSLSLSLCVLSGGRLLPPWHTQERKRRRRRKKNDWIFDRKSKESLELTFKFGEAEQLQLDDMAWHRFQNDGLHNIKRHYAPNVQHLLRLLNVCVVRSLTIIYFPSHWFCLIPTDNRDTVELWHNSFFPSSSRPASMVTY